MAHNPGAGTAHSPPSYYQPGGRYGGPSLHPSVNGYPTAKQQRSSPNNTGSPYGSPPYTNGNSPNTNFSTQNASANQPSSAYTIPYLSGNYYANTSISQTSSGVGNMASNNSSGAMGPPSKPVDDRPVDVNDLGDVLAGSGVDLREEEANLVGMMRKPVGQSNLHGPTASIPAMSDPSSNYLDPSSRDYNAYSRNVQGSRANFYGGGTFNQHALTEEQLQEQVRQKQIALVRRRAELHSQHSKFSFLNTDKLITNVTRKTDWSGIQLPTTHATAERSNNLRVSMMPTQNTDTLAVVQGSSQGPHSAADVTSLLSLACRDRIRSLVEHSIWMAKSRLETSHGEVPVEFKDIAIGQTRVEEIEIDISPSAQSRKRKSPSSFYSVPTNHEAGSFTELNSKPHEEEFSEPKRIKTIMFSSKAMSQLDGLIVHEKDAERKRIEKRALRNASQLPGDGITSGTSTPGGTNASGQSTANTLAEIKKMTKKELKKASESKVSEADIAKASNLTASMALGGGSGPSWLKGMGGGSKKKDWLKSKQPGSTGVGSAASRSTSSAQVPKTSSTTVPARPNRPLRYGEQREDVVGYRRIQVRDLLRSLELDRKEKRTLSKAYNKQN